MILNKGDIIWYGKGRKPGKKAVIVSNNQSNRHLDRFQVVPLEKSAGGLYAGEVELMVQGQRLKAVTHRLMTISQKLSRGRAGTLTSEELMKLNIVLQIQLDLL
ncbi:MAG: type II toxin-antitoxin system PemK/MazF family toxin [Candidatus Peregrinibacteria bacterium]